MVPFAQFVFHAPIFKTLHFVIIKLLPITPFVIVVVIILVIFVIIIIVLVIAANSLFFHAPESITWVSPVPRRIFLHLWLRDHCHHAVLIKLPELQPYFTERAAIVRISVKIDLGMLQNAHWKPARSLNGRLEQYIIPIGFLKN